jgi:hypothetical protein
MTRNVVIRYTRDVPAAEGRMPQFAGAEYVVSQSDAEKFHPDAKVLGYEAGNGLIEPIGKDTAKAATKEKDEG